MKRIIVGISGASGVELGLSFIKALPSEIEKYVIVSDHAKIVLAKESNTFLLDDENIGAITASGSFKTDAMAIIPCSMNTLAKITHGIADNLLTRTASVMIKEKRPLLFGSSRNAFFRDCFGKYAQTLHAWHTYCTSCAWVLCQGFQPRSDGKFFDWQMV